MSDTKSCINCVSFIPGEHHWCKDEKFTMYLMDISEGDEEFPDDGTMENIAGYYGRNCEGYEQKKVQKLHSLYTPSGNHRPKAFILNYEAKE